MRRTQMWIPGLALALALMLAGCSLTPGESGSDAGTADTPCDNKDNCDNCLTCALNNSCKAALAACQQNSACTGIDQCLTVCAGDVSCEQGCYSNNPDGLPLYENLLRCSYCKSCPSDCAGFFNCE